MAKGSRKGRSLVILALHLVTLLSFWVCWTSVVFLFESEFEKDRSGIISKGLDSFHLSLLSKSTNAPEFLKTSPKFSSLNASLKQRNRAN